MPQLSARFRLVLPHRVRDYNDALDKTRLFASRAIFIYRARCPLLYSQKLLPL